MFLSFMISPISRAAFCATRYKKINELGVLLKQAYMAYLLSQYLYFTCRAWEKVECFSENNRQRGDKAANFVF